VIRDAQGGKASRHACAALSATTFHDVRLCRLTTINHALRSYIYRSAVRSMCPDPPADLPSAYPHLAFTRKTTNLPLCGRTHRTNVRAPLLYPTPRARLIAEQEHAMICFIMRCISKGGAPPRVSVCLFLEGDGLGGRVALAKND